MALEAIAGFKVFLDVASTVREAGNNAFLADDAWKTVTFTEKMLECYLKTLEDLDAPSSWLGDDQHGLKPSLEAVKAARAVLEGERDKLKGKSQVSHMVSGTLFRDSVDRHLRVAKDVYNDIFNYTKNQAQFIKAQTLLRETQLLQLRFSPDERYVPLDDLEEKISYDLQRAQDKSVIVVLFGGPGTGKSTLARKLGSRYIGQCSDGSSIVNRVVILECGKNADVAAKQTELFQKLGGHVSQTFEGIFDFNVAKWLQTRFKDQHLLIILDDVWAERLLFDLVALFPPPSESGAKWLFTSQQESICQVLDPIRKCVLPHKITNLSAEDAVKVLASYAGFKDKCIPEDLCEVADDIIERTERNPLALATLGVRIANTKPDQLNPEVWENILDDIFASDSEELENVHMFGIPYPRSFVTTTTRSIDSLTLPQKHLIVLIGMCRPQSVSQHALQFLYDVAIAKGECNAHTFRTSCTALQSRHLLAKNEIEFASIHSIAKEYVLKKMGDTVESVKKMLNEATADSDVKTDKTEKIGKVTRVLADLFIHDDFRCGALAVHSHPSSNEHNSTTMEHRRTTSEPIMRLLVLKARTRITNQWTEKLGVCAQNVLLEFVNNNRLDQQSISQLLDSKCAVIPILTFLKGVCILEPIWNIHLKKSFWEGNSIGCVSQAFLKLLGDGSCTLVQEEAVSVLADLCWSHKENSNAFANAPGMLSQLALFLAQTHNSNLQTYAARVLAACAFWDYGDGSVVPKIVAKAGLVKSLVKLLAEEQNLSVQIAVGHALSNLATAKPTVKGTVRAQAELDPDLRQDRSVVSGNTRDNLAQWPGLLEVVTKMLDKSDSPVLQVHTTATLANIAGSNEVRTLETLLHFPELVNKLVDILNKDRSPQLQGHAARALRNLATYRQNPDSPIRQELLRWPGLAEGLAKSLLRSETPSVQLMAFSHLTYRIEKDTAHRLINHPDLMESLMEFFPESQNSSVEAAESQNSSVEAAESQYSSVEAAALGVSSTLCSLTNVGDNSLRARIARSPPFLVKLTKSILAGKPRAVEANVVCLIANLAVTSEADVLDNLVRSPGLVGKLAESLGENENSSLQVHAIRALLNLAGEENNDDFNIDDFRGRLEKLETRLLRSGRPELIKVVLEVTALKQG